MADGEYLCLTLLANPDETESQFKSRLTAAWTQLLRSAKDTYDAVYAEAKAFERTSGVVSRAYMVATEAALAVAAALAASGVTALALDADDVYTKYEASGSEWFQIAH